MRRIIISTMYMVAAIVLAASCNKNENPVSPADKTVITAVAEQIGAGTKVEMAYRYDALWQTADQIHVKQGQTTDKFTLVDGVGTTKGTFKGTKSISGEIEAFYPISVGETMEWPDVQTSTPAVPMYAKQAISGTGAETVSFSSLGAMLQIAFSTKSEDITITSITLEHNKKPLSGKFTVDENGQAIMENNDANPGVTLSLGESGVPVGVAATYFYLAIPAGTYSTPEKDEMMTITFKDDVHGKWCTLTSTTFPEIKRNTVGRITLAGDVTNLCTVKFDLNFEGKTGEKTAALANIYIEQGHRITTSINTPFARNYAFRGWYKERTCKNPWDFGRDVVNENTTLYAKWVEDPTSIHGHPCVKLAGLYWATENLSDDSTVETDEDTGDSYFFDSNDTQSTIAKWNVGSDNYNWALPDKGQWDKLNGSCTIVWVDEYSYKGQTLKGLLISGKAECFEDGNSIFLPALGGYNDGEYEAEEILYKGSRCFYWMPKDEYMANGPNRIIFNKDKLYPNLCVTARAVAQ